MQDRLIGNLAAREAFKDAEELTKKIEQIKATDPQGWEKDKFGIARVLVINAMTKQRMPKEFPPERGLEIERGLDRQAAQEIQHIHTVEELQNFADKHGLQIQDENFEEMVYECYIMEH